MHRLGYYLSSVPTLVGHVKNWHVGFGLLLKRGTAILELQNGCRFKVRSLMDIWIVKETCLDRAYESAATPIQDGWTVIDVGAGLGDFAVSVAHEHPHCRIYAYEPFPESYALLQENLRLNSVDHVRAFPFAVGARSGEMSLFVTGAAVQHTTTNTARSAQAVSVQGLGLDDVFEMNAISRCDFLKIDCEGGEFDLLFHASEETLRKTRNICLEYHDGFTKFSHTDLVNYLQQRGFQVKITPNPVHGHLGLLYAGRPPGSED